jgi:hypothetical protein
MLDELLGRALDSTDFEDWFDLQGFILAFYQWKNEVPAFLDAVSSKILSCYLKCLELGKSFKSVKLETWQ